jgi:hypothetical protein
MDISVHHYLRVILSTFLRVLILMGLFSHLAISYSSGPRTVVHLQLIAQSITMGGDTATRRYRCSRQLHNINPNRGIKFMPTGWALHSHEHCDAVDLTFTRDRKFSNGSRSPAPRPLVPRLVLITGATGMLDAKLCCMWSYFIIVVFHLYQLTYKYCCLCMRRHWEVNARHGCCILRGHA